MNKKYQQFLNKYCQSYNYKLDGLYKKPSIYKQNAYNRLATEYFNDKYGLGFKVVCGNSFTFSVGWLTKRNNIPTLVYQTAYYRYYIRIPQTHHLYNQCIFMFTRRDSEGKW